jgi:excisionase family DNA binding protein
MTGANSSSSVPERVSLPSRAGIIVPPCVPPVAALLYTILSAHVFVDFAMTEQLLTVEQVAQEFQLTSQTIRNWIRSGALSAVKIGHVYRVKREDVDTMMRRHQGETAPLGTHRDLWAPETLGMPYRRREARQQPSIWDGTTSTIEPPKRT